MVGSRWTKIRVGDLVREGVLALNDGYRVRNVELGPVGIPFVRGGDIGEGEIHTNVEDHIRPEFADRVKSKLTRPYDVAFITKGTVGRVGLLRPGQPTAVFAPQVCYWRSLDPNRLEPRFLFYLLRSAEFQANLDAVKTHGAMAADYVSLSDQHLFKLTFPPIEDQRTIAAVLGALDDKIELNRRMNATLEAMARALFQSWFVDFDPVRAKQEGCPITGLDEPIAALFPEQFQDSELGPIPQGWRVVTVGETCDGIFSGGTPSTKTAEYWNGGIPWLSSGETRNRFITETEKTITSAGVENSSTRVARAGCTVIASAGQGHTRGQTSLLTFESYINQSVVALSANTQVSSDRFLFFDLERRYDEFRQISDSHSSRGSLTTKLLAGVKCVLPSRALIARFDDVATSLVDQITSNLHQSRTLATLRDTLLPKLLSGELMAGRVL